MAGYDPLGLNSGGGNTGSYDPLGLGGSGSSQSESSSSIKDAILGAGHAASSFVGAAPGFIGGLPNAVGDVITGKEKPSVAMEGLMGASEELNPYRWLQRKLGNDPEKMDKLPAAEIVNMIPETIMKAIAMGGQGYGNIAAALGISPDKAKEVDYGIQLAMTAGSAFIGGNKMRPKGLDNQSMESFQRAKGTYPTEEVKPMDTTQLQQHGGLPMDEPIPSQPGTRSSYNLPQSEIDRLTAELNPPTEQRVNGQGELFTGEKAYDPSEIVAGSPRTLTKGGGGREAPIDFSTEVGVVTPETKQGIGLAPVEKLSVGLDGGPALARDAKPRAVPWEPQPDAPKFVPKGQRGSVDPSVFLEGLGKLIGIVPKTMEAAKGFLERGINSAMDRRDIATKATYERKLDELNRFQGDPNQRGAVGDLKPGRDTSDEKALATKAVGGDQQAFKTLFERYEPRLQKTMEKFAKDPDDARELVQRGFFAAFSNIAHFRGDSSFGTWLTRITINRAKDWRREERSRTPSEKNWKPYESDPNKSSWENEWASEKHEKQRLAHTELTDDITETFHGHYDQPDKALEAKQMIQHLNRAMEKLPKEIGEAIRLKEIEGYSYEEIAKAQNANVGTVKSRLNRGRQMLSEYMSKNVSAMRIGKSQHGAVGIPGPLADVGMALRKWLDNRGKKDGHLGGVIREAWKQFDLQESMKPLQEIIGKIPADKLQDIGDTFRVAAKGMTDKTFSILSESKNGAGQLLKWVTDREKMLDMARDTAIEVSVKGDKFLKGMGALARGFEHRVWGEDGALTVWRQMYKDVKSGRAELMEMKEEWISSMLQNREPTFRTAKQKQVYDTIQGQFKKALEAANKAREALGYAPIPYIKNYFPALWMGDYRLAVRNKAGELKGYFAHDNVLEANLLAKRLKKEFPDMEVSDPYHIKRGKYDLDTSAFEEAMRVFGANDPATKALHAAYAEIVGKRGFGGNRGIKKNNILGFMGSEKGLVGVKNAEKAIETYLTKMYNYEANLKKGQLATEIAKLPREVSDKLPNAVSLAQDYLTHARGGELENKLQGIDDFARFVARGMGTGESSIGRNFSGMRSIVGLYWLGNLKFIATQGFQHLNAMAKMVELTGPMDATVSYFDGLKNTIKPDQNALNAVNWAGKKGYLDSVLVELMDAQLGSQNTMSTLVTKAVGITLGKVEQEMVRIPTFLMFEANLRKTVKDPQKRYSVAAELMDHYMVNYRQAAKPMVYNHLGEVMGQNAAPLKQYAHNSFGQFFEYLGKTKDLKSAAPLVTFMGTQALVGGLKGVMVVAEATLLINMLNALMPKLGIDVPQIPTPEEFLLTSGLSDFPIYGLASKITGQDMSSSVSAPNVPGLLSLPVIDFETDAMKNIGTWAIKDMMGEATDVDKMKAALAAFPSMARGTIERIFTPEGQPVANPNAGMQGNWIRSNGEWLVDQIFGGRSIDEAKANAFARAARQDLLYNAQQKKTAISAITDRVMNQQQVDPELMQQYVKEGGDMGGLQNAIKKEVIQRNMTYLESKQIGKPTANKGREMSLIQEKIDMSPKPNRGYDPLGLHQ